MNYLAGCCSTTMLAQQMVAPMDYPGGHRLARASTQYDYLPQTTTGVIRVLIAGDHDCLRASLKTMLELDPRIRVVGEAADDSETIKASRKLHPDVLLIDLDMRCCDHLDALREITQRKLASSVVALSIHDDKEGLAEAQAAGANVILEKGVPYRQLISAIRLASANSSPR
jgi:DNA-binding NarL/FixJ family response regulator